MSSSPADPRHDEPPYFSIVVPVYNRAAHILPTLRSCISQTFKNFEVIVVDDGSKDDLAEVVEGLRDRRFRYIWRKNGGGGAARNTGIDIARGTYIAFLDSDDLFLPSKLETVHEILAASKHVALYSYAYVDRGVGRYWIKPSRMIRPDEDVGEYLFVDNEVIQTSTIVIDARLARDIRFDPRLRKGQDLDFCLRIQAAGENLHMIEQPLSVWTDRSSGNRVSHTPRAEDMLDWLERIRPILTDRAEVGFRATVLSYDLAKSQPAQALVDLARGIFIARISPAIILRSALRAYLPQSLYRYLVNTLVRIRGRTIP